VTNRKYPGKIAGGEYEKRIFTINGIAIAYNPKRIAERREFQ
jgi:hypothetical protein